MPGSTPINVPTDYADQAIEEVLPRQRDAEAEDEIVKEVHTASHCARSHADDQRVRQAERPDEQRDAHDREQPREQEHLADPELRSAAAEPAVRASMAGTNPACSNEDAERHEGERGVR